MIHTKECPICHLKFKTEQVRRIYCSIQCSNRRERRKRKHSTEYECEYQMGIYCQERNCKKCGWNPEVAKARAERMMGGNNG